MTITKTDKKKHKWSKKYTQSIKISNFQHYLWNKDTPELRIFWVFPANPRVQTLQLKFRGIVLFNGKLIKNVGDSIMNSSAPWSYNGKFVCTPGLAGENPHLLSSG